jgi:hypothetical protein
VDRLEQRRKGGIVAADPANSLLSEPREIGGLVESTRERPERPVTRRAH